MERVKGIEPSSQAWEARILPLNHTRADASALVSRARPKRKKILGVGSITRLRL